MKNISQHIFEAVKPTIVNRDSNVPRYWNHGNSSYTYNDAVSDVIKIHELLKKKKIKVDTYQFWYSGNSGVTAIYKGVELFMLLWNYSNVSGWSFIPKDSLSGIAKTEIRNILAQLANDENNKYKYHIEVVYYSNRVAKETKTIHANSMDEVFGIFWDMNDKLTYINGSYYKFKDPKDEQAYREFMKNKDAGWMISRAAARGATID